MEGELKGLILRVTTEGGHPKCPQASKLAQTQIVVQIPRLVDGAQNKNMGHEPPSFGYLFSSFSLSLFSPRDGLLSAAGLAGRSLSSRGNSTFRFDEDGAGGAALLRGSAGREFTGWLAGRLAGCSTRELLG